MSVRPARSLADRCVGGAIGDVCGVQLLGRVVYAFPLTFVSRKTLTCCHFQYSKSALRIFLPRRKTLESPRKTPLSPPNPGRTIRPPILHSHTQGSLIYPYPTLYDMQTTYLPILKGPLILLQKCGCSPFFLNRSADADDEIITSINHRSRQASLRPSQT